MKKPGSLKLESQGYNLPSRLLCRLGRSKRIVLFDTCCDLIRRRTTLRIFAEGRGWMDYQITHERRRTLWME